MPRIAPVLTQKIIDAAIPPKSGRLTLRDHDQKGLSLRISASGAKSWSYEFRSPLTGRNARITLADGSLVEARASARELRAAVASGRDPSIDAKQDLLARQAAHSAAVTVADALDQYEAAVVKLAARIVSRRARMALLRKAVEPFNGMPVASLKRGAIVLRLDEIHATRGPIARNRTHSEIRAWQTWMHDREIVDRIELAFVKKQGKEQARERVLTDAELAAIMLAANDRTPFSDIIRVLTHTGMRKGEAANLQPRRPGLRRRDDQGETRGEQDAPAAAHCNGRGDRADARGTREQGRARGFHLWRRQRLQAPVQWLGQKDRRPRQDDARGRTLDPARHKTHGRHAALFNEDR